MGDIAKAGAAIVFFRSDAENAKLPKLWPQITRELVRRINLGRAGAKIVLNPAGDHVAHFLNHWIKVEFHKCLAVGPHGRRLP